MRKKAALARNGAEATELLTERAPQVQDAILTVMQNGQTYMTKIPLELDIGGAQHCLVFDQRSRRTY
jgi:hypothetical protein